MFRSVIAKQRYKFEAIAGYGMESGNNDGDSGSGLPFSAHLSSQIKLDLVHKPVGDCQLHSWESIGDHQLDRVDFEITEMMKKQNENQNDLKVLRELYLDKIVTIAQNDFLLDLNTLKNTGKNRKGKGKGKKSKKSATDKQNGDDGAFQDDGLGKGSQTTIQEQTSIHHTTTSQAELNAEFASLIPPKIMATISEKFEIASLNAKIEVTKERSRMIEQRLQLVLPQRSVMFDACRELYHSAQTAGAKPPQWMRRQSARYRGLHPTPDREMNIEDLPGAIKQINGQITEQEYNFISMILQLPRRQRVNLKLFSAICALSEKVSQLEPILRGLLNKIDTDALQWKIERAKLLFTIVAEQAPAAHTGTIPTEMLYVELRAGGLSEENALYCIRKFDRDNLGYINFLDFLIFLPLFVALHENVIDNPLFGAPDLLASQQAVSVR